MLVFRLLNFIRGYVVINLNVTDYEKKLNLLQRRHVKLWDIERLENGIKFKISYDDFKKYNELLRDSNPELVKKTGVAFKVNNLKFRKGFIAGIFLMLMCYFIFASLVWNIEIVGANHQLSKKIIKTLDDNNIKMPEPAGALNSRKIEALLHKNFENLKFVEAYVEGSKLIIFVKEKEYEKQALKEGEPSSIVSSKNAIINKIITKNGQTVVQVGDVVYEGQTLVMGIIKNKNTDEFMMVPSDGIVYGKTYYSFEMKEEKVKKITVSTNIVKKAYFVKINGKNIKIIGDTEPFKNYNYREKEFKIPIISKLTGTSFVTGKYCEQREKEIKIDENTAKNKMKVNMYDKLIGMCSNDSSIVNTSFNFQGDEKYYYMTAQVEIIEDIGKKVKIYPPESENKTEEIKED